MSMNVITVALYVSSLGIFINSMHSFICDSIHKKKTQILPRKENDPIHCTRLQKILKTI